nr:DUF885 family protein [Sphingomonas quercus]
MATTLGLDSGAHAPLKSRLDSRDRAHRLNLYQPLLEAQAALAAAPRDGLGGRDRAWLDTARWNADAAARIAAFPYGVVDNGYNYPCPYAVSQLTGAYVSVPDFLHAQHVIANRDDCEAYLARLASLPGLVDQDTATTIADAGRGVVPPGFVIDRALVQLNALRADRGENAGLVRSLAARAVTAAVPGEWQAQAVAIVDGPLAAALTRQIEAMTSLRARAAAMAGVGRLPQGAAYYAMCLRFHTTTEMSPAAAHKVGLAQVAEISARADALMRAQGHAGGSVAQRITALGKQPDQLWPNTDAGRAALLGDIEARLADMRRRLPAYFDTLPRTPLEVRRIPPAIELGAPGAYSQSGSIDGKRPGAIYFNLHDTANWPKWLLPSTVYHEGLPGHHLQGSIANEDAGIPTLIKLLGSAAYNEGWALYAEQLADEMGVYADFPLGRLGMLQASLFRACRIVVDTGMHALGWSREQAIAYMIDNAGETQDDARREVERYCAWPGQACAYKIGHLEFARQREQAKRRMGGRFNLKGFHDAVLLGGAMPLSVMATVVDEWSRGGRRG